MEKYINRKLLKKRFKKRLDWLKKDIHDEYSGALYDGCEVDINLIDEIPAADVAPVVHGQWLDNVDYMFCSKCGMQWNYYDNDTQDFKYCPNCGAKMDGGDNVE